MLYSLMHEDTQVAVFEVKDSRVYNVEVINTSHCPLVEYDPSQTLSAKIGKWLTVRGIPDTRQYLNQDTSTPIIDLLILNYGVSLTDHYWYRPIDTNKTWYDINPYTNDFESSDVLESVYNTDQIIYDHFSPSPSLEGNIKKKWIIKDGKRLLVKGNIKSHICAINEVFASKLHKEQSFCDYVPYNVIKLHSYDKEIIGCSCECFTSLNTEFVSAYYIAQSSRKPNDINSYEYFINYCVEHGCNESELRSFLNYMFLTDFIRSETDRHGSNFGILRNSHTLEFIKPCPIFDNGNSMFYDTNPVFDKSLFDNTISNFFEHQEQKMLRHITDFNCVDTSLLPDEEYVYSMYKEFGDDKAKRITEAYRRKVLYVKNNLQHKDAVFKLERSLSMSPKVDIDFIDRYCNLVTDNICKAHKVDTDDKRSRAILAWNLVNPDNTIELKKYRVLNLPSVGEQFIEADSPKEAVEKLIKLHNLNIVVTKRITGNQGQSNNRRYLVVNNFSADTQSGRPVTYFYDYKLKEETD